MFFSESYPDSINSLALSMNCELKCNSAPVSNLIFSLSFCLALFASFFDTLNSLSISYTVSFSNSDLNDMNFFIIYVSKRDFSKSEI